VSCTMHPGLISCPLGASLRTVARMMATYRVHAILVTAHGEEALPGGGPWGTVSDTDLIRAAGPERELPRLRESRDGIGQARMPV
jgi:CBS domain-containing protein